MGCFSGKKTRNQVSDLRISNTQNPCRKSKSCSKRCCVDERNLQSLHLMKMLQLQNLLQKSSKFYTFSQARGYTAGVSQKAARHRWHRGITCCIPPMGLVKLPAEKTHRKTSNHFAHLRVFVYSWVFAAATTASKMEKYLMTIFHQPPTSPEILGDLGEIPILPLSNFPQFRLFSCNIQLAKLTQLLAFRHLHMKSGYPSPSQANKKVLILLIEEILHQVTNW